MPPSSEDPGTLSFRAAVVIDDDFIQGQLRCDVVAGDGAGDDIAQGQGHVGDGTGAAVPHCSGVAGWAALTEGVSTGIEAGAAGNTGAAANEPSAAGGSESPGARSFRAAVVIDDDFI